MRQTCEKEALLRRIMNNPCECETVGNLGDRVQWESPDWGTRQTMGEGTVTDVGRPALI